MSRPSGRMLKSGGDVNAAQGDGMTALHWAATHGDAALTQMLLVGGREHSRHDAARRHHARFTSRARADTRMSWRR